MTIAAYTGLPGHGKSYGVVENVIVPALQSKRDVFTNIPMNNAECLDRYGMQVHQFETNDVIEQPKWWSDVFIPGSVIVIDEIWRLWPSGLNTKKARDEDKSFLAEHRHMVGESGQSTEIVFVTQDLSQIANFARCLVETTFRVVKLSKVGLNKHFRVDVYSGCVTGSDPPVSKREREIHGKFKKDIFELYKSHTKSVTGSAGNETRIDKRFNVLGSVAIKAGFIVFVIASVAAWIGFKSLSDYYGSPKDGVKTDGGNHTVPINRPHPPAQVALPRKQRPNLLGKAKNVFITSHSVEWYGNRKMQTSMFEVHYDGAKAVLSDKQLSQLGYDIEIVSDCLAIVKYKETENFVLCRNDVRDRGWVESIVSGSNAVDSS
jgi:zona occludens toxin